MNEQFALKLYNVSLTSRGYRRVVDWTGIHPTVRAEFVAIAEAARTEIEEAP